jgi:hypothetical protein
MKRTLFIFGFILITITAWSSEDFENKAKYLISITKYISWPETTNNSTFKIAIYGSFDLYKGISNETLGRTVGQKNIEIINVSRLDQLSLLNPHILIISNKLCNSNTLNTVLKITKKKPGCIIGEKQGTVEMGADMNFYETNGKLGFKIDCIKAARNGLKISKQLTNYIK